MLCSNLATQYPQTTRIHIPKQIVNAMLPLYIKHKVIHKHGVLEKKRNIWNIRLHIPTWNYMWNRKIVWWCINWSKGFFFNISFVVLKVEINIFVALRIETWDQCFLCCVDCYIESWEEGKFVHSKQ
jgi:hypothetical protein